MWKCSGHWVSVCTMNSGLQQVTGMRGTHSAKPRHPELRACADTKARAIKQQCPVNSGDSPRAVPAVSPTQLSGSHHVPRDKHLLLWDKGKPCHRRFWRDANISARENETGEMGKLHLYSPSMGLGKVLWQSSWVRMSGRMRRGQGGPQDLPLNRKKPQVLS